MKGKLLLIIGITILVLLSGCPEEEFESYTNEDFGFRMKYHKDWVVEESPHYGEYHNDIVSFTVIIISKPDEMCMGSVAVTQPEDLPEGADLDYIVETASNYAEEMGFEIVSTEETTISGYPAIKVTEVGYFDVPEPYFTGEINAKSTGAFTFVNGVYYGIGFACPLEHYDKNSEDIEEMIESFEIIS